MRDDERVLFVVCLLFLRPVGDFGDGKLHERPGICPDPCMLRGNLLAKHRVQAAAREARRQVALGCESAIMCHEDEFVSRTRERDIEQTLLLLCIAQLIELMGMSPMLGDLAGKGEGARVLVFVGKVACSGARPRNAKREIASALLGKRNERCTGMTRALFELRNGNDGKLQTFGAMNRHDADGILARAYERSELSTSTLALASEVDKAAEIGARGKGRMSVKLLVVFDEIACALDIRKNRTTLDTARRQRGLPAGKRDGLSHELREGDARRGGKRVLERIECTRKRLIGIFLRLLDI